MTNYIRIISIVILERPDKQIHMQLRDNIPHIGHPNHWGIFGGGVEDGEDGMTAALREIEEELLIDCDPQKIRFLKSFEIEERFFHLFYYPLTNEMDQAQLQEGQRIGTFTSDQILAGEIEGHLVVPHHLNMLRSYWGER